MRNSIWDLAQEWKQQLLVSLNQVKIWYGKEFWMDQESMTSTLEHFCNDLIHSPKLYFPLLKLIKCWR